MTNELYFAEKVHWLLQFKSMMVARRMITRKCVQTYIITAYLIM